MDARCDRDLGQGCKPINKFVMRSPAVCQRPKRSIGLAFCRQCIERVRGQVSESLFAALGWEMGRIWQSDEKVKDIRVARRHARAVAATAGAGARSNQDWGIGLDA